jgi:S-adenosylmethionine:tRNA ribosyltransferase-isomerase
MIAASAPVQRPRDGRLLVIGRQGALNHLSRVKVAELFRAGDVVVANDAATLPASLSGMHVASGASIEVRLAGRASLAPADVQEWLAVVFGTGDFHTRTEERPQPPRLAAGDRLMLGPLTATVQGLAGHPRLIALRFAGSPAFIWAGLTRHGRPIQYAHVPAPLALWDVWTPFAAAPVALEPPSAGFALDWGTLAALRARGATFVTLTLAAGISSTGDPDLDRRLPFDEPYFIPRGSARAIALAVSQRRRIVAIGTTVVRALEQAGTDEGIVRPGHGIARQRVGPHTPLRIVGAILSGTHEPDSSHYELLRAFAPDELLKSASRELEAQGYRTHEFGDSVFVERHLSRSAHSEEEARGGELRLVGAA